MNTDELTSITQNPKNAKGAIVQKLSKQWPLTLKQMDHALKREFGMDVTYQAIHKAMSQLEDEKIVEKMKEGYQLHAEWIQSITKLSSQISQAYANNQPMDFEKEINQLKFTNWIEMGRFITFDFKENTPNPDNKPVIMCFIHAWPVNTLSIEETQRIEKFARSQKHYCICASNTPLDQTATIHLEKMHIHPTTGAKLQLDHDYAIKGDHIAHIYYEKPFLEKIDLFYHQTKDINTIDVIRLQKLVTEKTNINVIIVKNKELAEQLRNEALKFFKTKKK